MKNIEKALQQVYEVVLESNVKQDIEYFNFHKKRYLRMAESLGEIDGTGKVVLDIGSHYLHSSLLLQFLGYEVYSMDVAEFWDLDFIKERKTKFNLRSITENNLESFESHANIDNKYDIILFTEILEHITFNPIHFWKRMHTIVKPNGLIYISTPNSLNLFGVLRTIGRIFTFRGIGIPIDAIFTNVTYGHHWKEYSAKEAIKYFSLLSDDFKLKIKKYHYRKESLLSAIGNRTGFLAEELEIFVRVQKTNSWKIKPPVY